MKPGRKADLLQGSASFARAGQARSVRRQLVDNALGGENATELPLRLLAFNPDNPREELGDVTRLGRSMKRRGQLQPAAVMTRGAYLAAKPDREAVLDPEAQYVVIEGNRRLAAAHEADLPTLKVVVNDKLGTSSEEVLEAALIANVLRKDLTPLETAKALKELVDFYGTQDEVAEQLDVTQPWISQQLSLLSLTPELRDDLETGRRRASHLRGVGHLPAEEQRAAADAKAEKARQDAEAKRAARARSSTLHNAVMKPEKKQSAAPQRPAVVDSIPWHSPQALARLMREHMTEEDRATLAKLLTDSQ